MILTAEVVGTRMAGPAIRAWEIAHALSRHGLEVVLAAAPPLPDGGLPFRLVEASQSSVAAAASDAAAVVVQVGALELLDRSRPLPPLVIDLYDPSVIEGLELYADLPESERREHWARDLAGLRELLRAGDLFLCASQRQRHFWIGALAQAGRVNPLTYRDDPSLRRLLAIVPFGVPDAPPEKRAPALRGRLGGIEIGDTVGVWGGGMWNWFDPQLLVEGMADAAAEVPSLRVVFLGADNPNPSVPRMRAAAEARTLADGRGVTARSVFFLPGWLPYSERASYLLDADFGITLHRPGIEAELAFRTRVLDYLWAGLPVVATGGDALADLLEEAGAGIVVPPGNRDAVTAALLRMAREPEQRRAMAAASRRLGERLRWSAVTMPLVEFCRDPRHAPDRGLELEDTGPGLGRRALRSWRRDGPARFAARAYRYLRRRL